MKQVFRKFRNRLVRPQHHLSGMKSALFCVALSLPLAAMAQKGEGSFYYYHNEKIPLTINHSMFFVASGHKMDYAAVFRKYNYQIDVVQRGFQLNQNNDTAEYWQVVQLKEGVLNQRDYDALVNGLNNEQNVIAEPVVGDSMPVSLSNYFYVKLKDALDLPTLRGIAKDNNCEVIRKSNYSNWCILRANADANINTLELTSYFYETKLFEAIDPAFMFQFTNNCTTDPLFQDQWGLKNTSYPNADINACDAWTITTGDPSVIVAVLDQGIDLGHLDLVNNLSPFSYDTYTHTSPSQLYGPHATHVAGIIGAEQNTIQISGVAPNTTLMSLSNPLTTYATLSGDLAEGFLVAIQNGARIINNSWGDQGGVLHGNLYSTTLEEAIDDAIDAGVVVVFAAGNHSPAIDYPASYRPEIFCIGSTTNTGMRSSFSGYGNDLDGVAPGSNILSTLPNNSTGYMNGTSMAAPHAAGVAALVLAENPCLGNRQVMDIIESTSQKLASYNYSEHSDKPNGTWNNETGYGLVDAYEAAKAAQELYSPNLDVYIKDVPGDFGSEPASYDNNTPLWVSSDIWTRNQDDGIEQHQNLQYDPNNPGFVYVKVRNKSCEDLDENQATLHVYFAKAGTFWANWPFPWTNIGGNPPVGGEIGNIDLPAIPAGGEKIISIPWYFVPNPQWYVDKGWPPNEIHHFCILARIVSNEDPMYSELIGNSSNNVLAHNISYNNNVAMKNISIVDFQQFRVDLNKWVLNDHAAVKVGTALSVPLNNSKLRFAVPTDENGNPITTDAEVKILLDPTVWAIWQNGGAQGSGFSIINPDAHELLVTEDVAELTNLNFPPQILGNVAIQFNFLTEVQDEKNNFTYDLTQFNSSGEVLGGERFQIVRPGRDESDMFEADIDQSSQNSLTAQSINEPATYSWYSADTTLIDTGMSFVVSPGQPAPAFLSVTADTDGYKDYVVVNANSAANGAGSSSILQAAADSIVSLSPNPASSQVMVQYHIGSANVQSAQLKVTYVNNPAVLQVVNLNPAQSQKSLNIGGYAPGVYIISLYVDGQQKDSKQLIIQ